MKTSPARFLAISWTVVLLLGLSLAGPAPARAVEPPVVPARAPFTAVLQGRPIEIRADAFGLPLADHDLVRQYGKPAVRLERGDRARFSVSIEAEGDYTVAFDVVAPEEVLVTAPEGQLLVDGTLPVEDARRIVFPVYYRNSAGEFPLDHYGNETLIPPVRLARWAQVYLRDVNLSQKYPLAIHLSPGAHAFEFSLTRETVLLGSIYLRPFSPDPSYSHYLAQAPAPDSSGVLIEIEAEWPSYKNDVSIRPLNSRSLDVTPYDTYRLLLNTIGGESWQLSGSSLHYEVEVPQDGMYLITLRAQQSTRNNLVVFRRITVNGAVPFDELNSVPFCYATEWTNVTLPYRVYLQRGANILGLEATTSPYDAAIENIRQSILDINALSLEIRHLTGNQVDRYREWEITEYIPNIDERLADIAAKLDADKAALQAINGGLSSQEIMNYQIALDNILLLHDDPNKIPVRMNRLSEGPQSAAQLLGSVMAALQKQPLALDKIYLHSPDITPSEPHVSAWASFWEGLKRFLHSFERTPYQPVSASQGEIQVWVNRPRQYVALMQQMADLSFTPQTGIRVQYSLMPDESKLALAIAADIEPDVVLGLSTGIPYELALRDALYDLRSFEDFDSFIRIYSPGSLLGYIINDSVYAVPETQDFWVTFYRRDILDSLQLAVPHTWDEVIAMLPDLQRYGMNYYTPLSTGSGLKGYLITAPYIWNLGGELYSPDGLRTGLGSDESITAIKFMAEQFTVYGMPLTAVSFYDSFRNGNLPVGISNVEAYIKLRTAAPEIEGLWGIDLYPATLLPDGTQNRYATGSAQVCIILADTAKPRDSWEFLKWWMSTETQVAFERQLIMYYGPEYLWYTANVEAFRYLPIPEEHKDVILAQWEWLREPVKLPGTYMLERSLSNAWNQIVFDGINPRVAIDNAILITNREMARKMEDLDYVRDGVLVQEIRIPSIETVRQWVEGAGR
ncbi:MAG: extracellular solute-binding protein [Anaerolineae bacterium]|nr:extracellular solute-binding protein [Anaerolineae bacterium]